MSEAPETQPGSEFLFHVEITASGSVHDAEGNLISETPITSEAVLTAAQLTELGLPVPPHPDEEK